jgi:hypothetical protein
VSRDFSHYGAPERSVAARSKHYGPDLLRRNYAAHQVPHAHQVVGRAGEREVQSTFSVPRCRTLRSNAMVFFVVDLLKEHKSKSKTRWIFTNEHDKPEGHFLRKFKPIAKKAGLNCGHCKTTMFDGKYHLRKRAEVTCAARPVCEKHYLHRLRKTCATRWLRSGINLMNIKHGWACLARRDTDLPR